MKKTVIVFIVMIIGTGLGAQNIWTGNAATGNSSDFPGSSEVFRAKSRTFPQGTLLRVSNPRSGDFVDVEIISRLEVPGVLILVEQSAADAIGLPHNQVFPVRVSPLSSIQIGKPFSIDMDGRLNSTDPDINPNIVLGDALTVQHTDEPPVVVMDEPLSEPADEPPVVVMDKPLSEPADEPPVVVMDEPLSEPADEPPIVVMDEPLSEPADEPPVVMMDEPLSEPADEPPVDVMDEPFESRDDSEYGQEFVGDIEGIPLEEPIKGLTEELAGEFAEEPVKEYKKEIEGEYAEIFEEELAVDSRRDAPPRNSPLPVEPLPLFEESPEEDAVTTYVDDYMEKDEPPVIEIDESDDASHIMDDSPPVINDNPVITEGSTDEMIPDEERIYFLTPAELMPPQPEEIVDNRWPEDNSLPDKGKTPEEIVDDKWSEDNSLPDEDKIPEEIVDNRWSEDNSLPDGDNIPEEDRLPESNKWIQDFALNPVNPGVGESYVQIGAYRNIEVFKNFIGRLKANTPRYPLSYEVSDDGLSYRLLIGPLRPAEKFIVLQTVRSTLVPDAFHYSP